MYKLEKAHYLRRVKDSERKPEFGKLLKKQTFVDSMNVLVVDDKMHLVSVAYALLASGTRGVDLTRISRISKHAELRATALIPFDKTNTSFKTVELDYQSFDDSWLVPNLNRKTLFDWLGTSMVTQNDLKQLRLSCFFRPHELRATRAILLILDGLSKEQVMNKVGWKSECSLLRYVRSDFDLIAACESYEAVEALVNDE